jgi:hypothetical protein
MALITYAGLKEGVLAWMARIGDEELEGQFDNFLALCERRMYYGYLPDMPDATLHSPPLRIPEIEFVDPTFNLYGSDDIDAIDGVRITELEEVRVTEEFTINLLVAATVAQPTGFLELISARLNSNQAALRIIHQRALDGFATNGDGVPSHIAVSGVNFRVWPEPSSATYATLRYYAKLTTPVSGTDTNDILTNYPDVYLDGCLIEGSIYAQDVDAAQRYLQMYNASVMSLNHQAARVMPTADQRLSFRGRRTP